MRSRWYHKPLLHTAASGLPKEATWLELFYDLVFVAAFIQLGNGLASDISFRGALAFAGAFAPLWVAWSGFTFFANRFALDDFVHRAATLAQMLAVGAMAIAAPGMVLGDVVPFCFATGAAFLIVALMHLRTHR